MNIDQQLKKFSESKNLRNLLIIICSLIGALVIFQAGILVGFHKAKFSRGLGNNYYKVFDARQMNRVMEQNQPKLLIMGMDVPGGHGAVGKVIQINLPTFIVAGPDNLEKVVRIKSNTAIKFSRSNGTSTDIKIDDNVVVVGTPNENAEVEAKLIRIIPAQ